MPNIRLLGGLTSPFTRKVRIACGEKNIPIYFDVESSAGESMRIIHNPLGKVPIIIVDGEQAIYDSRVIAEYLEMLSPLPALLPPTGMERIIVKQLEALGDGICDACALRHAEGRRTENRSQEFIDRQTRKFQRGIEAASQALGDRLWCHGTSFSQADIAIGTALSYITYRFPENDWKRRFANLKALHDRLLQRPAFAATEPK